MKFINFIARFVIKLLIIAVTVSFALVKFVISMGLVILSLGAFASSTSRY